MSALFDQAWATLLRRVAPPAKPSLITLFDALLELAKAKREHNRLRMRNVHALRPDAQRDAAAARYFEACDRVEAIADSLLASRARRA